MKNKILRILKIFVITVSVIVVLFILLAYWMGKLIEIDDTMGDLQPIYWMANTGDILVKEPSHQLAILKVHKKPIFFDMELQDFVRDKDWTVIENDKEIDLYKWLEPELSQPYHKDDNKKLIIYRPSNTLNDNATTAELEQIIQESSTKRMEVIENY